MIPDQAILVNSIVLQEARLSSEIENIVTTQDDLYKAVADLATNPNAKEVMRYREALWHGYESLATRPISTNLCIEIARIIKRTEIDVRRVPGTKIADSRGRVIYTPPEGEALIRDKLANLEEFIHADDSLDPLVKMAVMHYQFEAIHPFSDGNGRTGRILNILFLVERKLLEIPVLFLSHYIIRNKDAYYEGLRRVTERGAWEEWVLYMLKAIEITALETLDRLIRIRDLIEKTQSDVKSKAKGIYSKDLVEVIFRNPYCRIRFIKEAGLAERHTASRYLQTLEKIGVLKSVRVGREAYYINERLLKVLIE